MNSTDVAVPPDGWTVTDPTPRADVLLDQLLVEIRDAVAVCVVSARERRVLAHRGPEAFPADRLGEALYTLAGSAIEATETLGGDDLFGAVRDGMVLTESAAIHYRVVGDDRALIVVTDLPDESALLEVARRVLAAYDPFVLEAVDG